MRPAIEPGDWLLLDPTIVHWPRRGSVVVFREPDSDRDALAVKRVAAGPGDRIPFAEGYLELAEDEAWLLSDASPEEAAAAGFGEPIDSRRYGPVQLICWWDARGSVTRRSAGSAGSRDSGDPAVAAGPKPQVSLPGAFRRHLPREARSERLGS